jgi:hypothetical protein
VYTKAFPKVVPTIIAAAAAAGLAFAAAAAAAQYGQGVFAPGIPMGDEGMYKCGHNLLRAHAKTFELYHKVIAASGMTVDPLYDMPYLLTQASTPHLLTQQCSTGFCCKTCLWFGQEN